MQANQQRNSRADPASYQRHIDGLRAVAVLSVIFHHFNQPFFDGGYVGVDVFFVISGYLISKLLLEEIRGTGHLDFKRFYIRRMRRLLPALAVTLGTSLLLAFILFSPERFAAFGRSLGAAVFSVSNFVFWSESGYFDAAAKLKPLLHTWSLGVEEQFYFIWPALLWFTLRGTRARRPFLLLAVVGLASFALNILWVEGRFDEEYASTIFYLTPFRIFELVIGAMAVLIAQKLPGNRLLHEALMLSGLALIAFAVVNYHDELIFPYYYALAPCAGALLVILARKARTIGWLMRNPLAVGTGLISYSLYLVHWPALVFYQYYLFTPLRQVDYLLLFAVTVALSTLMYFCVEKPLRKNSPTRIDPAPQKRFVLGICAVMGAIALAGIYSFVSGGATPFNEGSLSAGAIKQGQDERFALIRRGCDLTRLQNPDYCDLDKPHQVLVLGNSHEPDGYNAFHEVYKHRRDVNLISFGTIGRCDIHFGPEGPVSGVSFRRCAERTAQLSDTGFVSRLTAVIYSANKPFSLRSQVSWGILQHLHGINPDLSLVVIGGYINSRYDCSELFNRYQSFASCAQRQHVEYNPFIEKAIYGQASSNMGLDYLYIDKTHLLCNGESLSSCTMQVGDKPAFYDAHHLSLPFSTLLGQRIARDYGDELVAADLPAPLLRP